VKINKKDFGKTAKNPCLGYDWEISVNKKYVDRCSAFYENSAAGKM